jgi:hypothetical protein
MTTNPNPFRAAFIARALVAYRRRALAIAEQERRACAVPTTAASRN